MKPFQDLKIWFKTQELPSELQLNTYTHLPNVKKTVEALISTLEAHPNNRAYIPYYNLLLNIKNRIENETPNDTQISYYAKSLTD